MILQTISQTFNEWDHLKESISKLHELPIFLPTEWMLETLAPAIAIVTVCLTVVYMLAFQFVDKIVPPGSDSVTKSRVCYQVTNLIFNVCVGCVGLYQEYWVLPTLASHQGTHLDRITGDRDELYLVSAMQLGYQFWAIPVGILYVHESLQMILHHFAVVASTSCSGFLTAGFRYYTPFFYGVMELSSLPLSVMNSYKDNPEWIKKDPTTYAAIRAVFAFSFLYIRVFLCAWKWPVFLRDNFVLLYTREYDLFKAYLLVQWSLAAFLAILQLLWASLILKGIFGMLFPRKKKDAKKRTKGE